MSITVIKDQDHFIENVTKNEVDKFNLENSDKQIFLGI